MSQLTEEGLEVDSFEEIVTSMAADYVERTGVSTDAVAEDAPDGVLVRIVADRIAEALELLQAIHSADDEAAATGDALDALSALTGTVRETAAPSTTDSLVLVGTTATVVPTGSQASSESTGTAWQTIGDATLVAATTWASTTAYVVGDLRENAGNIYRVITAGTSAGAGGPTTEDDDITDGTVHWAFIGAGDGLAEDVSAAATETGPKSGLAYTIQTIDTPVSGWNGVVNMLDADEGTDLEADADLRVRRVDEISAAGASIPDAIRARLLRVDGVTSVTVFFNNTDITDGDGIPPHSVEALVKGGEDQDIWDALLVECVAGGIATHGTEVGTAEDSQGTEYTVKFTRPTEVDIYVIITVEVDADLYPTNGDTLVEEAIVAFGDSQGAGRDSRARPLGAAVVSRVDSAGIELGVAGVIDTPSVKIGTAPAPTLETTIAIGLREQAVYDSSRISVVVVEVDP